MSPKTTYEVKNLETLLKNTVGNNITIVKQDIRLLTAPGENYGSVMLSIDIVVQENNNKPRSLHLVAKKCPPNDFLCEIFNIQETFKKETAFYTVVIPAIEKFESDYIVGKKFSELFARCYGSRNNIDESNGMVDDDAALILENLKILGYETNDRLIGFDKAHAELILLDLAKFHSVPIAMRTKQPEIFENKIMPFLNRNVVVGGKMNDDALEKIMSCPIDILAKHERSKPFIPMIKKSMRDCLTGPYRFKKDSSPFTTIVHTDYWVNNTMVMKDSNGKPLKNKIVDLQIMIYNTIVYDLLFFLYSSVQPNVLHENFDYFLRFYYDAFIKCLSEFEVNLGEYSWEKYNEEINENACREIGHLLIMFKPILTVRGAIEDMSDIKEDTLYNSGSLCPDYESRIINSTLSFIERDWIKTYG